MSWKCFIKVLILYINRLDACIDILSQLVMVSVSGLSLLKYLDRLVWANSVDQDQTAPKLG